MEGQREGDCQIVESPLYEKEVCHNRHTSFSQLYLCNVGLFVFFGRDFLCKMGKEVAHVSVFCYKAVVPQLIL